MDRMTVDIIMTRVNYLNEILERMNSAVRVKYERKFNGYALYEVYAANPDVQHGNHNIEVGTKQQVYDALINMIKGIELATMHKPVYHDSRTK